MTIPRNFLSITILSGIGLAVAAILLNPACRPSHPRAEALPPAGEANGALVLKILHPSWTTAGVPFNVQPDGESGLAVTCEHATRSTEIVFGAEHLKTVFGSETLVTTTVPERLYRKPGVALVHLQDGNRQSENAPFTIHQRP